MMVALWFLAIGVFAFSGYRIHNYVLSRRAHKRYGELAEQWNIHQQEYRQLAYWINGSASFQSRGFHLPWQEEALDRKLNECMEISRQMAECAEEF